MKILICVNKRKNIAPITKRVVEIVSRACPIDEIHYYCKENEGRVMFENIDINIARVHEGIRGYKCSLCIVPSNIDKDVLNRIIRPMTIFGAIVYYEERDYDGE